MWLLDVNMPKQLTSLLKELGRESDTAQSRRWDALSNGRLVEAAVSAGFTCLLSRDKLFGESASRVLDRFPEFAVVLVTLPQLRAMQFLEAFRNAWKIAAIVPVAGEVTSWPS